MSDSQKLACVAREIALRRSTYPRLIKQGIMSKTEAEYEIRMMEAIAHDYRAKINETTGQGNLFGKERPPAIDP